MATAFLLFANLLFSQTNKDTITRIIHYGMGVYAKDIYSFKPAERNTIDSLIQQDVTIDKTIKVLENNNSIQLKKVGGFIKDWWSRGMMATGNNAYPLLIKTIEEKLVNGGDGPQAKDWRQKNVALLFTNPVRNYLNGAEAEPPEEDVEATPTTTQPATIPTSKTTGGNTMLSIIALALAGLAVAGVAAILFQLSKRQERYAIFRRDNRAELEQMKMDISQMGKGGPAAKTPATAAPVPDERLQKLEARLAQLESRLKPVNKPTPVPKNPAQPEAINLQKKAAPEPKNEPEVWFAKLPDLENGFSQGVLTDNQNGEKIYQIEAKGNTAIFMIVNDGGAQKYALSNYRYYLEKACDLLNEPTPNCRIDTKDYGELLKSGPNWVIQRKAQIEFV